MRDRALCLLADILVAIQALRRAAVVALKSAQAASPLVHARGGHDRYSAAIRYGTSAALKPEDIEGLGASMLSRSAERFGELLQDERVSMDCVRTSEQLLGSSELLYSTCGRNFLDNRCAADHGMSDCANAGSPRRGGPASILWAIVVSQLARRIAVRKHLHSD